MEMWVVSSLSCGHSKLVGAEHETLERLGHVALARGRAGRERVGGVAEEEAHALGGEGGEAVLVEAVARRIVEIDEVDTVADPVEVDARPRVADALQPVPVGGAPWTSWQFVHWPCCGGLRVRIRFALSSWHCTQPLRSARQLWGWWQLAQLSCLSAVVPPAARIGTRPLAFFSWQFTQLCSAVLSGACGW